MWERAGGPRLAPTTTTRAARGSAPELRGWHPRRRLGRLALGIAGVLGILLLRLGFDQVVNGSSHAAYANSEINRHVVLPDSRGAIYDRIGDLLAVSVPSVDVIADDFLIANPAHVATLLNSSVGRLRAELSEKNGCVILLRQVSSGLEADIANLGVGGITF